MSDEFVWLVHPDVGIPWRCPVGAIGSWTARGHEPCDPPAERDVTKDPVPVEPETEAEPEPPARSKKRADTAAVTEEGAE